ncbi:MAG: AAA family ATPase [Lachnospiraceae bacterium]|nr:AAA family ATPase [Lachnospiraceae bacterium]MCI9358359.1 AAA family ATPase [Lachnospiraceae bacterium]
MNIPVGTSNFTKIRQEGFYYIDKSGLIEELLGTSGIEITLIVRPRRFGKTLGMRMLAEFFDIRKDSRALFEGLAVSKNQELCKEWMNGYPVLFLTFKDVGGNTFDSAFGMLKTAFMNACIEHAYLLDNDSIDEDDKRKFAQLKSMTADVEVVKSAISLLIRMMYIHYGKPVVLLLDEYDVPIAKASGSRGKKMDYYDEMMEVVRPLISMAIKDNDLLKFAVITGCLRIAKESIFTGANNFVSDTIADSRLNEYFGFTQAEIDGLLQAAELTDHVKEMKKWYDGYHFGSFDVYCPWDVMNHVNSLILNPDTPPKNYWENTSDNAIIRSFLDRTQFDIQEKFETLLAGGYITETIENALTYDVLEASEENLWTLLYFTGYLTIAEVEEKTDSGRTALRIPNAEIMDIFRKSVRKWFWDRAAASDRSELFSAFWNADTDKLAQLITDLLFNTISYHDYRESYYHAFTVGLLSNAGYKVESNYECGLGRSDIVVKDRRNRRALVIEIKWTDSESSLEKACESALRQVESKQYAKSVEQAGYRTVIRLAMAFWKKQCLVRRCV